MAKNEKSPYRSSGCRATHAGTVKLISVQKEEVIKRGKKEDLRVVWESTELGWWSVGRDDVMKTEGVEEGWAKIVERIEGLEK